MSQIWIIITAALMVSMDALFTGFALGGTRTRPIYYFYISAINLAVCALAANLGALADWEYGALAGAALIIILGVRSIFSGMKKDEEDKNQIAGGFLRITLLALALSVDNACAALSLSAMDYSAWLIAVIFSGVSLLCLLLGALLSRFKLPAFLKPMSAYLPGIVLTLLGAIKILLFFLD